MALQNECIICYESIEEDQTLTFANCTHGSYTHTGCIQRWNGTCPLCRTQIDIQPINNIILIENYNINYLIFNNINIENYIYYNNENIINNQINIIINNSFI